MNTHITTIEGLAEMIQHTMASKEDIKVVREDIADVTARLDRIEKRILADYGRRIKSWEQDLKRLQEPSPSRKNRTALPAPMWITGHWTNAELGVC
jgi:hypothetical protein